MADVTSVKVGGWMDDKAENTYVQGFKWTGKRYIGHQADDVGKPQQDVILREHDESFAYTGKRQRLVGAGHSSSIGVEETADGCRVYIGHDALDKVGFYVFGQSEFHALAGLPNGDVSVSHGWMCIRNGERYRGYTMSSVKAGKPDKKFDTTIPKWGQRFQGHHITVLEDGTVAVLIHRDEKTDGPSRADYYKLDGGKLVKFGGLDTTKMGNEAEGFTEKDGRILIAKRVGGAGTGRTIRLTLTELRTNPKDEPTSPKPPEQEDPNMVTFRGGKTCECVATSLPLVEQAMLREGVIKFNIDIFQLGYRNDVSASAGTHAKGGCVDVGQYSDAAIAIWRKWGWTMQRRQLTGVGLHAHGWPYKCPHLAPDAASQARDWDRKDSGLVGTAKVVGPWPVLPWKTAMAKNLAALEEVTPVTPYWTHIDPTKVTTSLRWYGDDWTQRTPNRTVPFDVEVYGVVEHEGREYAVTKASNRYALEFLAPGKYTDAGTVVVTPPVVKEDSVVVKPEVKPVGGVTAEQIALAKKAGLVNVEALAAACAKEKLPFFLGCTILQKETWGKNIFGHDKGGAMYGAGEVTEAKYREFRKLIDSGKTSNGVGPLQLTWKGFFPAMEKANLRPWVPADNILYGVGLLADYFRAAHQTKNVAESVRTMGTRYNGASAYGDATLTLAREWQRRIGNDDLPEIKI